MTVAGQPPVTYGYDDANRLTSVTQGTSVVTITYDDADRRSTLTLPNGIVTTYGYDSANQLTSLTYALGQTTLGTLTVRIRRGWTADAGGRDMGPHRAAADGEFGKLRCGQPFAPVGRERFQLRQQWQSRQRRPHQLQLECPESDHGSLRRHVGDLCV